jgi:hypothetical protein
MGCKYGSIRFLPVCGHAQSIETRILNEGLNAEKTLVCCAAANAPGGQQNDDIHRLIVHGRLVLTIAVKIPFR